MMNDDFLKRLGLLEKSLEELKLEYLRRHALPLKKIPEEQPPPQPSPGKPESEPSEKTPGHLLHEQPPPREYSASPEEDGKDGSEFGNTPPRRMAVEWFIGRKLFGSIGMLLVLAGLCYGVVYAYSNFHLSPELRVGAACTFSILIAACGFLLKDPKYRFLSLLMKGGGLGGLYIAVFAGYNFYGFFGVPVTGAALVAVALLTLALSWFERSQVIGFFAVIGAFAMPLLVKTPQPNHIFFCFYILFINLPVIFLGLRRNWQALYNLSFILSLLLGWAWTAQYREITAVTMTFWSIFTVEYLILAIIKLRGERDIAGRLPDYARLAMLPLLNLMVLFLLEQRIIPGFWLSAGTLLYAGAAATTWLVMRRMYGEFILLLGATAAFLALTVMETVTRPQAIYLMWSLEALALGLFAFFARNRGINRLASLMAMAAWILINSDYWEQYELFSSSLFFNHVNVLGKLSLLALLIQGGLGMWRFEKSSGSKIITVLASCGLIAITAVNALYYFNWREPFLFFTALPLAVASLIYCWAAQLSPRFSCLKHFSVLWFIGILGTTAGLGIAAVSWWHVFWPLGALVLFWGLPRGNQFRPFAMFVCIITIFQHFMYPAGELIGFFNPPFLAALTGGTVFLALNWTPPWLRDEDDYPAGSSVSHGTAWGIIFLAIAFCSNFFRLENFFRSEYFFSEIGATLIAAAIVLSCLARRRGDRIFSRYVSVLLLFVYLAALAHCFTTGVTAPFLGLIFYIWIILLALGWGALLSASNTMHDSELIFLRLIGGTLLIYIIYREFGNLPDPAFAKAFSLIFLTLAAVLICGWGLWRQRRAARFYSFVLLGVAVTQLVFQSLLQLRDPARIMAFIALGLLLLGLSLAYHKVSELADARKRNGEGNNGNLQ